MYYLKEKYFNNLLSIIRQIKIPFKIKNKVFIHVQ